MNRNSLCKRMVFSMALLAMTAVAANATTVDIPVPNGSFDTINSYFNPAVHYSFTTAADAIEGWTNLGGGSKGIVDWYSLGSYESAFPNTPISATNFRSFFTLGSGGNTAMYTNLGHQVQEGTYTLSLKAGSYADNAQAPVFDVGFMVDTDPGAGVSFAWGNGDAYLSSNNLTAGSWQDLTHEWTVDASNVGQDLYIYFTMTSDNVWLSLDDFTVTHTVPEPATAIVLVAGAVVAIRRRKREAA